MDSSGGDGDADAMRRLRCEEKIDFDAPVTPLKAAGGSMMCVSATNSALSPHLMVRNSIFTGSSCVVIYFDL